MNKRQRFQKMRRILLRDWDPLGVGDNPNLADEYDSYLPAMIRLIEGECDFDELNQYLAKVERELGVQLAEEQRALAVRALLQDHKDG